MERVSEILLIVGGVLLFGMAIFHGMFWKLFAWNQTLECLNQVNRGILEVANIILIMIFTVLGYISIFNRGDLLKTGLGKPVIILVLLIFVIRLVGQFIFFKGAKPAVAVPVIVGCLLFIAIYIIVLITSFQTGTGPLERF